MYMYIYIYIYTYIHMYIYIYVCIHVYILDMYTREVHLSSLLVNRCILENVGDVDT